MSFIFWNWEKNPTLTGSLTGKVSNIGPFRKYVYSITDDEGNIFHTWGYAQLGKELIGMAFGTKIEIRYKGKEEDPDSGHKVRIFYVKVIELPKVAKKKKENG